MSPSGNSPYAPQPETSAPEFLPDKELSWSLNQYQPQHIGAQGQLPAHNPSSSAACAFLQSEIQEQLGPHAISDLQHMAPEHLIHGGHASPGMMRSDNEQSLHSSQAFSIPPSDTALAGMQDQSVHGPSGRRQSDLPLVEQAAGQDFMTGHLEQLSQPVPAHEQASASAPSHRHAFERPMGLSSFAMPFMNAPHSSHAMVRPSGSAQYLLGNHAVPTDVSQDHSFSSASSLHPDVWSTAPANFAEQGVPPQPRPPVILISQVLVLCCGMLPVVPCKSAHLLLLCSKG